MRILTIKSAFFCTFLLSLVSTNLTAQANDNTIKQDPKFEQLLNEKRKINNVISVNERYKIQIYSGTSDKAKKALYDFKQEFNELDGTIVFNTPNYKVWVGNFRTKIEAEHYLIELKNKFENSFIIKPQK